jgi:ADP-ribosyl-[dinitrogen reductase] hydrolase
MRDRARGALLGLAVGDALGTTLEFTPPFTPKDLSRARALLGPHVDITGGGPFGLAPGECTDDTQMACCLAASLAAHGAFDERDVLRRYRKWRRVAFDVGGTTGLGLAGRAKEAAAAGGAGNGSLMRTAPIGVFFGAHSGMRRRAAIADSSLTHQAMPCLLACTSFDTAVAVAIAGATRAVITAAVVDELRLTHKIVWRSGPTDVANYAYDVMMASGVAGAIRGDGPVPATGYVLDSWQLALWELWHAPSFEAGLIDCVNRGGDADTNGAITGALLGAYYGEQAIPEAWRQTVMAAKGLRPEYHPSVLLELVP